MTTSGVEMETECKLRGFPTKNKYLSNGFIFKSQRYA